LGGAIVSNIISTDTTVLLVTTFGESSKSESVLRGVSKETGITNLTIAVPASDRYFLTQENDSIILISRGGVMIAMNKNGSIRWKREVAEGLATEPFLTAGKAIIATTAKQIFTINLTNGEIETVRKSAADITAIAQTATGEAIAGDERGNLTVLNGTERRLWRFKSGGEISRIFVNGTHIIAASHDNFVYRLQTSNGTVEWKKRLGGRVRQIALLNSRYVLSAAYDERSAVITDLLTGKVAGQLPLAENEIIVATPIYASDSMMILTDQALHQYSLTGCAGKKESGQVQKP
jgi:outer membrane protein assembly factor BamB